MSMRSNHTPYHTVENNQDIVPGNYTGKWTGYTIILNDGKDTELFTDIPIKGLDIPVRVEVTEKTIRVYLIER